MTNTPYLLALPANSTTASITTTSATSTSPKYPTTPIVQSALSLSEEHNCPTIKSTHAKSKWSLSTAHKQEYLFKAVLIFSPISKAFLWPQSCQTITIDRGELTLLRKGHWDVIRRNPRNTDQIIENTTRMRLRNFWCWRQTRILITEHKIRGGKINGNQGPTAEDKNSPFPVQEYNKNNFTIKTTVNLDRFGE